MNFVEIFVEIYIYILNVSSGFFFETFQTCCNFNQLDICKAFDISIISIELVSDAYNNGFGRFSPSR